MYAPGMNHEWMMRLEGEEEDREKMNQTTQTHY